MKKIKVAFCLRDMQLGGVESVLIRTLEELQKNKDIDISVITYVKIGEPVYVEYFKQHPNIKCEVLYPCSWLGTKLPHFFMARIFLHFVRDIYRNIKRFFVMKKFDDINTFIDYHDFGFYDEFKKLHNAKKIAWSHTSISVFHKRKFINKLNVYDNLVVLTDEFKNEFNKLYSGDTDKLIRIYNPIDINKIKSKINNTAKPDSSFCCVSRLSGDKDIITVLNAFDMFWKSNNKPNVKLVIVGDGHKRGEYKKFANSLQSSKQIKFIGAQSNPFVYMKKSYANILSSFNEGLPTVLIEAATIGVLNIASACKCGPREILLDGRGGLLFEPGNAEQLSKCLTDVYNNNVDVKKMVNESIKALKRFDSGKIVKEIISLIS